jgi:di/tripeptidase
MPMKVRKLFLEILDVQSVSYFEHDMVTFVTNYLKNRGIPYEIDAVGNILAQKGYADTFPCLAAHLDTVHPIVMDYEVRTKIKNRREIAWSPTGIGGDDKCGILACLWMLSQVENIKLAFFTSEESSMIGSNKVNHKWFKDCGYIIQLDRWGRGDFIAENGGQKTVSSLFLKNALPLMDLFGYKVEEGLITDSINLWNDEIGISCVNVSCGYYQHHSIHEKIDLNETWNALVFTRELIFTLGEEKYSSLPIYRTYRNYYGTTNYGYGWWYDYKKAKVADEWSFYANEKIVRNKSRF